MQVSKLKKSTRICIYELKASLVFISKYDNFVFTDELISEVEASFKEVCRKFKTKLIKVENLEDKIYIEVEYPATISLSVLVNSLKGVSSRKLDSRKIEELVGTGKLPGFWSPSYYAGSLPTVH